MRRRVFSYFFLLGNDKEETNFKNLLYLFFIFAHYLFLELLRGTDVRGPI